MVARAPDDLMIEFLAAVSEGNHNLALTKCSAALKVEPENAMLLEYQQVLQRALKVEDDDTSSSSSSSSDDDTSHDDEEERKSDTSLDLDQEQEEVSLDEMHEDLAEIGLQGTQREMLENLLWIKTNCREEEEHSSACSPSLESLIEARTKK